MSRIFELEPTVVATRLYPCGCEASVVRRVMLSVLGQLIRSERAMVEGAACSVEHHEMIVGFAKRRMAEEPNGVSVEVLDEIGAMIGGGSEQETE